MSLTGSVCKTNGCVCSTFKLQSLFCPVSAVPLLRTSLSRVWTRWYTAWGSLLCAGGSWSSPSLTEMVSTYNCLIFSYGFMCSRKQFSFYSLQFVMKWQNFCSHRCWVLIFCSLAPTFVLGGVLNFHMLDKFSLLEFSVQNIFWPGIFCVHSSMHPILI